MFPSQENIMTGPAGNTEKIPCWEPLPFNTETKNVKVQDSSKNAKPYLFPCTVFNLFTKHLIIKVLIRLCVEIVFLIIFFY